MLSVLLGVPLLCFTEFDGFHSRRSVDRVKKKKKKNLKIKNQNYRYSLYQHRWVWCCFSTILAEFETFSDKYDIRFPVNNRQYRPRHGVTQTACLWCSLKRNTPGEIRLFCTHIGDISCYFGMTTFSGISVQNRRQAVFVYFMSSDWAISKLRLSRRTILVIKGELFSVMQFLEVCFSFKLFFFHCHTSPPVNWWNLV